MESHGDNHLLYLDNLSMAFGGLMALAEITFGVPRGAIKAVIGPNGAGKTTLFHLITGFLQPLTGRITFEGQDIQGLPPHTIAGRGVARTFQLVQLFDHMTVLENVMVGRHRLTRTGLLGGSLRLPGTRAEEEDTRRQAMEALRFVGLERRAQQPAGILPLGLKRLLEIARALAAEPTLFLLDEPASGLDSRETDLLKDMILALKERGITLILVEHDMELTMEVADEIAVLNYGRLIADGPPRAVQKHPEVIAAYLGSDWQG